MAIVYLNNGTRNLPLAPNLAALFEQAAQMAGIADVRIMSGGQPSSGPHRTGSHRHDNGNSGDIQLVANGRVLDFNNAEDLPYFVKFIQAAKGLGAGGIGAGNDYMGGRTIHVGYGTPAVWGAGGRGANAPQWLRQAYGGGPVGPMASAGPPKGSPMAPSATQGAFDPANGRTIEPSAPAFIPPETETALGDILAGLGGAVGGGMDGMDAGFEQVAAPTQESGPLAGSQMANQSVMDMRNLVDNLMPVPQEVSTTIEPLKLAEMLPPERVAPGPFSQFKPLRASPRSAPLVGGISLRA